MRRWIGVLGLFVTLTGVQVRAQNVAVPYHDITLKSSTTGALFVAALANVAVCTQTANTFVTPCTPTVTIYQDAAATRTLANPFQSDGSGNYQFFALPGYYTVQVYGDGVATPYNFQISLPLGGVAGVVTTFSSGNLSPLFTTSVATPTTTPALTFSLSNAAANTLFGNCTVTLGLPSFCTLTGAMLPNPSATTLGGIQSFAAVAHQWINAVSTLGVPSGSQPAFTDISGTLGLSQGGTGQTSFAAGLLRSSGTALSSAELSGDASTSGSNTVTVAKVNGTSVPTNSAADQAIVTTAAAAGSWASIPLCGDATHALAYSTSTHTFSCQSLTGSGGTVTGSGTANTLAKWTAPNAIGNSTIGDSGSTPSTIPQGADTVTQGNYHQFTVDTGGVTAGQIVCITANVDGAGRPKVSPCSHTATNPGSGLAGIAFSTVAAGAAVEVCWTVNCSALYDNATTVRDEAILSTTTDGELHDSGGQTATAGQPNFAVLQANGGAGTEAITDFSGLTSQNPVGGGGGGNGGTVKSVTATLPITVTPPSGKGAVVVACATCSTSTGTTSNGPSQTVLAGPATAPNANGGISGPVTVCESATNTALVNCVINGPNTPSQPLVVGQFWLIHFNFAAGGTGCTLTSSLGNTISAPIFGANNYHAIFSMTVTVAGTSDTITPSASCGPPVQNPSRQTMEIINVTGASAIDSSNFSIDSPTQNEEIDLTTTRSFEPVILFADNASASEAHDLSLYPAPVVLAKFSGWPAYDVRFAGTTGTVGTSKFFFRFDVSAFSRAFVVGLVPSTPLVSQIVCTGAVSGALASCASGGAAAIGQTITVVLTGLAVNQTSCAATDQLGNTYTFRGDITNQLGAWTSTVTVAGTPTVTFTSCAGVTNNQQQALVAVLKGVAFSQLGVDFHLAAPYSVQTAFSQDYLLSFIDTQASGTWTNDSQFHALESSTTAPAFSVSDLTTNVPAVYSAAPTFSGAQNGTEGAVLAFSLVPPVVYPLVPRQPVSTDITPPQLVTQTIPQGTTTYTADGSQAGSWVSTLSVNLTSLTFTHMQDGVTYSFNWTQNATGGYLVTCPASVNFCPAVDTVANHITTWRGVWNAAQNELAFYSTTSPQMCINNTASPSCGSALAGFVVIPVSATSTTVLDAAIQANDAIAVHEDSSLGAALGVTCNTGVLTSPPEVTARTAATSFVITTSSAPATNPGCYSFTITHTLTAGPLDPPAVTRGLVLNEDANFQGGTNGTAVASLTDYSGNNNTATASTGATYNTNQINGKAAWTWSGNSNQNYSLVSGLPAGNFTIFFEFLYNSATGFAIMSGGTSAPAGLVVSQTTNQLRIYVNGGATICQSSTTLVNGTAYQANITYNSSTGVCAFRVNEAAAGGATSVTSPGSFTSVGFAVGDGTNGQVVAQILYYNVVLTASEIAAEEADFKGKFGN